MVLFTSRSSSWLRVALLTSTLLIQLPTICMAQDTASEAVDAITANAKTPNPSSSTSTRPSSTSSAPAQTHTIQVGLADHKFNPDVTEAKVGDTVEFRFYPANHSVVRAEYGFPCIPYEMTGNNKQGFFSGFNAVDKVLDNAPKYSLKINSTDPIFFYCSAPGSCLTYGMVGAINPNSSTSITTQQQKAKDSAYMLNPGEPFPAESPLPSNLPSSTSIPIAPAAQKHTTLGAGAIAGIVVAVLAVVALAAALFFFVGRSKTLKDEVERKGMGGAHSPRSGSVYSSPQLSQQAYFSPALDRKYTSPAPGHAHTHSQSSYILPPPGHPAYSTPPTQSMYSETSTAPYELPHSTAAADHQRTLSEQKLGAYGKQENRMSSAPPYGWHVNTTPAEMEGTPVVGQGRTERARWEEVHSNEGDARQARAF